MRNPARVLFSRIKKSPARPAKYATGQSVQVPKIRQTEATARERLRAVWRKSMRNTAESSIQKTVKDSKPEMRPKTEEEGRRV